MGTLRIREVFTDSTLKLIAVESVDYRHTRTKTGGYMYGSIEPIAVIVCGPDGTTAFDTEGKPASVEQLRKDIPGLDGFVSSLNKPTGRLTVNEVVDPPAPES